jgi:predicted acyl esterase
MTTAIASTSGRLAEVDPELERLLREGGFPPPVHPASAITCRTELVPMRDGIRLATDLYLPPALPAPVIVSRTPYGRDWETYGQTAAMMALARRGYVVVAQDCRGTGGSEPDRWDYFVYEAEDGPDTIDWVTRQDWYGGFIGSWGGSYVGVTQWHMALHPAMSTVIPSQTGLGIAIDTARLYLFFNAYARVIGKGPDKVPIPMTEMERYFERETMAGGFFNEPLHPSFPAELRRQFPELESMGPIRAQRWLWERYCAMTCADRAAFIRTAMDVDEITPVVFERLPTIFGQEISHATVTVPHPSPAWLCRALRAPPLIRTAWYDWHLNYPLATWELLRREGRPEVDERARMIISPYAHNMPGYHVAGDTHPELLRMPSYLDQVGVMLRWYQAVRDGTTDRWPRVIYYLMGANEWRAASDWPVPEASPTPLYLAAEGRLRAMAPSGPSEPDRYRYDPADPPPTVGGSIVSFLYRPGSADVRAVQARPDVLTYTTEPLRQDVDVVGPLRMILYAASSAADTDFVVRLSDVFPDGRAIQMQLGILRARYRNPAEPALLEPGRVYRLEVDLWATACRFRAGHRIRVDVSSADFPHFDRNANRGGADGPPLAAEQTVYHDREHPSHLVLPVLAGAIG